MKKSSKAYKTIGEVAEILELDSVGNKKNTHTIRYWESEFKQIKPIIINKTTATNKPIPGISKGK